MPAFIKGGGPLYMKSRARDLETVLRFLISEVNAEHGGKWRITADLDLLDDERHVIAMKGGPHRSSHLVERAIKIVSESAAAGGGEETSLPDSRAGARSSPSSEGPSA